MVSLVEVRGTNNSLVHPRGAVGVVTRTPAGAVEKHFLVRFPDGFETSLTRDQLDVLKHFKDRLPGSDAPPTCNGRSSERLNNSRTTPRRAATGSCRSSWRWR